MNAKELAAVLTGNEYGHEVEREDEKLAHRYGLVVVFGASDDLMEFRGAVHDEIGACDDTTAYITPTGLLQNDCGNEDCPHFKHAKEQCTATIEALWCAEGDYSWTFKTDIPHETFEITEDGEPYCRGIVFALADVAAMVPA